MTRASGRVTRRFYYAPKTAEERLDSAVLAGLMRHMDSLATNAYTPNKFERGDWTVGSGDSKWGVDQQYIHIGRFRIPTAILALLPRRTCSRTRSPWTATGTPHTCARHPVPRAGGDERGAIQEGGA
jgi:hypothetical protein